MDGIFTADPSGHVWDGTLYVYPSHDVPTDVPADDDGSQYDMRDYHVLSMDRFGGPVTDHGVALDIADVPWAQKQMWAPDAARRGDTYYLYFPARTPDGVFRIGVATSKDPAGPFVAEPEPITGAPSIDPAVFTDADGASYLYTGGLAGGQLQRYDGDTYTGRDEYPADDEPALGPRVARLSDDMLQLAEPTREVVLLDEDGSRLTQGDPRRFFEASWMSAFGGTYVFMYSTGDTHRLAYATGSSPYGPFTYRGTVLDPVEGWTTHGSIVDWDGEHYLLYHSAARSARDNLRDVRMARLELGPDGSITTVTP
ncbi:glycoside hydrolase family 43 protein [Cellulomonas sp. URHB0016]